MFVAFGVLGALLLAYVVSLFVTRDFQYSVLMNGWLPDGFELLVAALCIGRGLVHQPGRAAAITLGCGLLSWCLGDTIWTLQWIVGTSTATAFLAAAFWTGFYPLACIGVAFFMRRKLKAIGASRWLDGAVTALGTAAVCAAFAFHGISQPSDSAMLTNATNLAYPIGDLLLLALVIGCMALLSGRSTLQWVVLAAACILNCTGDTFNLHQSTEGQLRVDAIGHALAWPAAGLLMAVAVWLRPRRVDLYARQEPSGLLLPGVAAGCALVVLVVGTVDHVGKVAVVLAVTTLVAAAFRLTRSARSLRSLNGDRQHQSMTDQLTGISNRRYLFELLDRFFADQEDPHVARRTLVFLFVDLDHFKEVNDSFGHPAGDELLRQLGPRLSSLLGRSDLLVRLGGDEFGVVLMDADTDHATLVAKQLTTSLEEPFDLDGVTVRISASIGIATAPTDASDTTRLLSCADAAMYRSKSSNQPVTVYRRDIDSGSLWRLGDELRGAIEQHELVLHYQPQLDLRTGVVSGVEALVRWQHPNLGMLSPIRFLPLAEHAGLMPSITAMLIDDALAQGAKWMDAGYDLTVSVNLSPTNLLDHGFTDLVTRLLERHHFPSRLLILEITETSVITNFERSKFVIQELADLGVDLSVDDFGAGFTALSYLSSLAVRELKLDCKLITDLAREPRERDRDLVRSTIELGHTLGLRVVAEGIEDEATLDLLRDLQCDVAQGYFIGRPVAPEMLELQPGPKATATGISVG